MCNRFPVHGFLLDPHYIRGSICDRFGSVMGDSYSNISKSRHFPYKFLKKFIVDKCVPNDLKWSETRKKTSFYGIFFSGRFRRSRWPMYVLPNFTTCDGVILERRLLHFKTFVGVPIGYRMQQRLLEYLYRLPRYGKPNMVKYCDIRAFRLNSNPYISKTDCQIYTKFRTVLGVDHVYNSKK